MLAKANWTTGNPTISNTNRQSGVGVINERMNLVQQRMAHRFAGCLGDVDWPDWWCLRMIHAFSVKLYCIGRVN